MSTSSDSHGGRFVPKVGAIVAGKYRIVDIPISNCINSGMRQVYVLTQYNSASLNRHLARTYRFDQLPEAMAYLETGRARGKVVVSIP